MPIRPVIPLPGPIAYTPARKADSGGGLGLFVGMFFLLAALVVVGMILSTVLVGMCLVLLVKVLHGRARRWRRSRMR